MRVDLHLMWLDGAPADWEDHLALVAPRYRAKAQGKAPARSRLGEFGAGLLLASVLGVRSDEGIHLGPEGKPALAAPGPHFNISHDDGLVALAVGEGSLGVDLEEVPDTYGEPQNAALRYVLSPDQLSQVEGDGDPALAFALAWTRVESVLKADGRGLAYPVRGGHLPPGFHTWAQELAAPGGQRHVVSISAGQTPEVHMVWHGMAQVLSALEGHNSSTT